MGNFKPRVILTRNQVALNAAASVAGPNPVHEFGILLNFSATFINE